MLATDDEEVEITKKREKMTGSRAFLQLTKKCVNRISTFKLKLFKDLELGWQLTSHKNFEREF